MIILKYHKCINNIRKQKEEESGRLWEGWNRLKVILPLYRALINRLKAA